MPEIKLYDFSGEDKQYEIEETNEDTGDYKIRKVKRYTVNMYGLDENGVTFNVSTTYEPWFCIKLNGIRAW